MNASVRILILAIAFAFVLPPVIAQEMKAEKWSKVQWYQMVMLKFKGERAQDARDFIKKNFEPVDKEIGRKVIVFDMPFGDWDQVVYFPLDNLDELNYKIPPSGLKWMSVFVKQQGGQEKATKLLAEWEGFVETVSTSLVRQSE